MSTTVDQRVVEMQFDNRHFEQNVSQTMSTLDKLKQKLHLPGAAKSLEDVGNAAKKVDMSPLANGVDNIRTKFSAMEVIGVTALANITNSAVNAGKRIVSALTIDPIKTGLSEYETQINATQTILANTQSKGSTIDDVNRALEELNTYADKTIYNFTEMTRNIGTFTAAGIDLETSTNAIQGIANLAAISGSTSQQASTAMYQLSQALASGKVRLMDWNSVVNAGMGGQVFQDALKETARVHGVAIDEMIDKHGSFRDTLSEEWLTSEILTETLQKFTLSTEGLTEAEIEANREMLRAKGYTEEQIEEIFKLGNTATDAATKVKTFTQMWDVLKEAAQSGWAKTWKLLIGDFEQAKALLTPLADFLTGIVNKSSEFRNAILESALSKGFGKLSNSIRELLNPALKAAGAVKEVTKTVADLGTIVDEVILGKWGNGQTRFDALTEAGYNYCEVQNQVNEKLDCSVRYSQEQIDAQNELLGKQKKVTAQTEEATEATENQAEATVELTDEEKARIKSLAKMSDEQLKAAGYSDKQIVALKELKNTAAKLGIPFDEFIDKLDEINGRWLMINGFKNIGKALMEVFKAIGQAWQDIFPNSTDIEYLSDALFNLIAGFNRFTSKLIMNEQQADKLRRTFAGVFAILDIVMTLTAGPLKIAFKIITKILGLFNLSILDVTAFVGDAIVKFRDWLDKVLDFDKAFDALIAGFKNAPKAIKNLWNSFKQSKIFQAALPLFQALRDKIVKLVNAVKETKAFKKVVEFFTPFLDGIKSWWKGLKEAENIPKYLFDGLWKGIQNGASKIWSTISNVIVKLIEIVKNVLGIESPSKVFMAIGGFIVAGLLVGLTDAFPGVWDAIGGFVDNILGIVGKVDWGSILTGIISTGTIASLYKFMSFLKGVGDMLGGVGDVLSGTGKILAKSAGAVKKVVNNTAKVVKSFSKVLDGVSWDLKAGAIKQFAIAIGILVGAIVVLALVTKYVKPGQLWNAIAMIVVLAGVLVGMAIALEKMSSASASVGKDGVELKGFSTIIIQLGLCMLMMAAVMKIIGGMSWGDLAKGGAFILAFGGLIAGLMAASKLAGGDPIKSAMNIAKMSALIKSVGTTFLLLAITAKIIGTMSWGELAKAAVGILAFGVVVAGLIAVTKIAGENLDKAATMVAKIGAAFLMLAVAIKIIGTMSWDELGKAGAGVVGLGIVIAGLIASTKLAGGKKQMDNASKVLLGAAAAIMILAITAKLIATMTWDDMGKAAVGILALGGIIIGLMAATKLAGKGNKNLAKTLLAVAGAIAILALVVMVLGLIDEGVLKKGVQVMLVLTLMMAGLIAVTKLAKDVKGSIQGLAILIGVLAAALIILTFIPVDRLLPAVLSLVAVLAALALVLVATGKMKNSKNAMPTLLAMAAILAVLGVTLKLLAHTPWQQSLAAAGSMSLVLLALAAAFKIIGDSKNIKQTVPILAMMAAIIAVLGVSMIFLAMMPWQQSLAAAGSMSLVLLALAAAFKIIGDSKKIKQTVPILAMMVAIIGAIGLVLAILSLMPITNAAVAAAALSITLLALAGAMKILSTMQSIQPTVIVALMVMVAAIAVIGTVMSLLGGMGGGAMITALVGIAGALVILVVALNLMNGTLAGSAALLIAAAALVVLAQALIMLGGLSWGQLLIGLVAIAGVLAILGVAGLLLGPVVPVIAALAAAIALLGVAFLAIGAGALLFGMAMNVIATAFPAMTAALTANAPAFVQGLAVIIQGLIAMIPMIVQGIGQGIITFCGVIVAAAPSVAQAFLAVLKAILDVIVGAAPMIIQAGIDLIVAFLNGIAQGLPRIIQAAFDLVIAFINGLADGIRNNTPKVTAAVRNLIDAILSAGKTILKDMLGLGGDLVGKLATGIKNAFGKAVQAAKDLGKKVLDGIKNFLGIHSPSTKFAEIGKNMVDGLINGIKNIIPNAIKAVKNLGSSVLNAICKVLGINSPSKEFAEIGEFSGLGFAEGLLGTSGTVNTAAEGVAGGALDSFRSVFSSADGSIDLGNLFNTDSVTPEGLVIDTDGIVGIGKGTTDSEKVEELQKVINYALEEAGVTDADGNIVQITVDGDWLDETQKYYEWFEEEWGLTADGFLSEEDVKTIEKRLEQIDDVAKKSADSTEPITQEEYDQKVADRGTNKTSILNDAAYQVYKDEANTALDAAEDVNDAEKKLAEAGLKHTEALNELDEANEVGNSARIKNAESAVESAKEIYGQAAEDLATAKNARDEAYEELNESYADLKGRLEPYLTDEILDKYMAASEHDKEMFNAALQEGLKALNQDGIITDEEISGLMSALDEGILSNEAREKAQYISAEFYSFLEDYMAKYHPELDMSKMTVADWDELLTIPELNRIQSEWYDDARYCTDGFIGGFMRGMDSHVTDMVELATLPSDIFATVNNIKSPSKVFEELGSYLVQGLLVGLSTYKKDVPGTVSEIGKTIQNLFGIVDPDMDIQPTITPVLDLSNIERDAPWLTSGSYTLQLATAGASSSSSSISTMMNQRGQNGNEDVVSAIDKLGAGLHDDIAGIDANVYNIKGITYNDENGITNAIKQIVKQVIREGRS